MSIVDGFVPPTINYRVADPTCDLDYTPNKGRKAEISYVLSNSLAFGGHNASLLFAKV
jgi:3-oxoacyl-[acyl-carrier-protein] synthase II